MGGGNPLKKAEKSFKKVASNRVVKGVLTGGASEIVDKFEKSNTLRALTGRETSMEKDARNAQMTELASSKAEADAELEKRRKRMELRKAGRGSLLSGSETGVATTSTLG
jgi:hypothetical protein